MWVCHIAIIHGCYEFAKREVKSSVAFALRKCSRNCASGGVHGIAASTTQIACHSVVPRLDLGVETLVAAL